MGANTLIWIFVSLIILVIIIKSYEYFKDKEAIEKQEKQLKEGVINGK